MGTGTSSSTLLLGGCNIVCQNVVQQQIPKYLLEGYNIACYYRRVTNATHPPRPLARGGRNQSLMKIVVASVVLRISMIIYGVGSVLFLAGYPATPR